MRKPLCLGRLMMREATRLIVSLLVRFDFQKKAILWYPIPKTPTNNETKRLKMDGNKQQSTSFRSTDTFGRWFGSGSGPPEGRRGKESAASTSIWRHVSILHMMFCWSLLSALLVFQESQIFVGDARCSSLQVISGGRGAEPTS
jgi:hypothetical protein